MAIFAVMGQMLADDAEAKQTVSSRLNFWKPPEDLIVTLGAGGYKRFQFTDGKDTVTFTSDELMAALKEGRA